jgi:DNA-directed RNA polymerase specialized sigma24 family protein
MATDPNACPTPEDLVALVLDSATPAATRDAALADLVTIIREVARSCASRLITSDQVRQDIVDESVTFVHERLNQYDPQIGPFRPWLQAVLLHFGMSVRRTWNRRDRRHLPLLESDTLQGGAPATSADESLDQLADSFRRMRTHLDHCAWPPSRAVDYYAVLLVFLRVAMAAFCRRFGMGEISGEAAEHAATWLPWHQAEELRRFRVELLCLSQLWHRLAPRLDQKPGLQAVLDILNSPTPPRGPVIYNTLVQWCHRARKIAQERLGPEAWNHGFARLLDSPAQEGL